MPPVKTSNCGAPATTCRRDWRTIFSGWAAIPNAPTPPRACCGARCCGSILNAPAVRAEFLAPLLQALEMQGQLPGISRSRNCARTPRRSRRNCSRPFLIRRGPAACAASSTICTGSRVQVRDRTSNDMWRVISQLNERLATPPANRVMLAGEAVARLEPDAARDRGVSRPRPRKHDPRAGWRFIDMGLRIERAIYLGTLLDGKLRSPEADNASVLEAVLEWTTAPSPTARATVCCRTSPPVFDLVLLDDKNPRSVLFQFNQLLKHFERLPQERENAGVGLSRQILQDCVARLNQADARELAGLKSSLHAQQARRGHPTRPCATCRNSPMPSPRTISRIRRFPARAAERAP